MSQLNTKPTVQPVAKPPAVQQEPGVKPNEPAQQTKASEETQTAIRQIVCTKKPGDKWEIKFLGPVARRDLNRVLVTIRVAFARQKRKQRVQKVMQERLASSDPLRAAHLESSDNGKS